MNERIIFCNTIKKLKLSDNFQVDSTNMYAKWNQHLVSICIHKKI